MTDFGLTVSFLLFSPLLPLPTADEHAGSQNQDELPQPNDMELKFTAKW
jgi:hypothetical protein